MLRLHRLGEIAEIIFDDCGRASLHAHARVSEIMKPRVCEREHAGMHVRKYSTHQRCSTVIYTMLLWAHISNARPYNHQ